MSAQDCNDCLDVLEHRLLFSTLDYARLLGGLNPDQETAWDLVVQGGYLYASGRTTSSTFLGDSGDGDDLFVTKLDPDHLDSNTGPDGIVWSTLIPSAGVDQHRGIAVDAAGNAYVARRATSTNLMFVEKLDADGNPLFTQLIGPMGPSDNLDGGDIALDAGGNVYVNGYTNAPSFFGGAEVEPYHGGTTDIFVAKYSDTGSGLSLLYGTFVGGSGEERPRNMALHAPAGGGAPSVHLVGRTKSSNFPVPGGFDTTLAGGWDGVLVRLDAIGHVNYGTYLGGREKGNDLEIAGGVAVDAAGNVYISGNTGASDFPTTPGAYDRSYNGSGGGTFGDAFVTKVNPNVVGPASLQYSTFVGGSGEDRVLDLALDGAGDVYIVGRTFSKNFPTTADAFQRTRKGPDDGYITRMRLSGAGSADLISSTLLGGSKSEGVQSVQVQANPDGSVHAFVSGFSGSADFPRTTGPAYAGGPFDAMVAIIGFPGSLAAAPAAAVLVGPSSSDSLFSTTAIEHDAAGLFW